MSYASLCLLLLPAAAVGFSLPVGSLDVLMRVRLSGCDSEALGTWLVRRPFAAMLPMQPMLVLPLQPPECGATVTFRRKPTSEKGGTDGGLRFSIAPESEEATGDASVLLVSRISEGQYTNKPFSERAICRAIKKDLNSLPAEVGSVTAIVDYLEAQQQQQRERGEGGFGQIS